MTRDQDDKTEARVPLISEKPHPMKRVPGYPKRARWDRYIGRWVIYRSQQYDARIRDNA